jgi:DnaJ-class molecular chaperone
MSPQQAEWLGWAVLAAVLYAIAYAISLRLHPYRNCRKCRGSGKHRGAVFERAFRACRACDGSGRQLRLFAKKH